ncbi:hypothetical protein GCM10025794_36430 [Massilia kyonggiensis]|jgi:hypothetical protein
MGICPLSLAISPRRRVEWWRESQFLIISMTIVNYIRNNDGKASQTWALATEAAVRAATSSQPNLIAVEGVIHSVTRKETIDHVEKEK